VAALALAIADSYVASRRMIRDYISTNIT
jgi:hypothetical protein